MNDFVNDVMSVVIIGDDQNEEFDGKIKFNGKSDGFLYHRDSIKQIINEFKSEGYSLNDINLYSSNEAGYDLVSQGHILFCNCTTGKYYFGYVFLPEKITTNQIQSLKLFEEDFQMFEQLYIMKIDEMDQESFEINVQSHEFNVNEIITKYYGKSKQKRR
ncbi:MAG: hypothetical protein WDA12_01795 [Bacilli bacterium]